MDDVTFSAESRSLWVMSYLIGGFLIGDEDCISHNISKNLVSLPHRL